MRTNDKNKSSTKPIFFNFIPDVEKVRLRCKNCKKRSWFYPEIINKKVGSYNIKFFIIKCPKCLSSGEYKYKSPRKTVAEGNIVSKENIEATGANNPSANFIKR